MGALLLASGRRCAFVAEVDRTPTLALFQHGNHPFLSKLPGRYGG